MASVRPRGRGVRGTGRWRGEWFDSWAQLPCYPLTIKIKRENYFTEVIGSDPNHRKRSYFLSRKNNLYFCLIYFIDNLVLIYTSSLTDTILLLRNMKVLKE